MKYEKKEAFEQVNMFGTGTPNSAAAAVSIVSRLTPCMAMTFRFGACAMTARGTTARRMTMAASRSGGRNCPRSQNGAPVLHTPTARCVHSDRLPQCMPPGYRWETVSLCDRRSEHDHTTPVSVRQDKAFGNKAFKAQKSSSVCLLHTEELSYFMY